MIYFTEGLPQRKLTMRQLDQILSVADNVLHIPDSVEVEILFVTDTAFPWCGDADMEEGVALITINRNLSKKQLIATLLHEMVHIKQILDGRLVIGEGSKPSTWEGKPYNTSYKDLPWEQEAFQLEQHMMKILEEKTSGLYRKGR